MTESAERARAEKLAKDLHLTDWDGGDDQGYGGEDVPRPKAVKAIMEFAALAVERERKTCADIAGGMTGPGNTVEQCKGYSDACRDIQRAIRARDAERG